MMLFVLLSQVNAIGVGVGSPLGLTVMVNQDFRILAGWNFNRGAFYMSIDKDFYSHSSVLNPMDFYIGFGGYLHGLKVSDAGDAEDLNLTFGLRIPLGLEYRFSDIPINIGLEVVPAVKFFPATDIVMFGDIYVLFRFE